MRAGYRVAILGATGAVGREFLELFSQREFPVAELRLLASARSAGQTLRFQGEELPVREVTEEAFTDIDVAFFSAGAERSRRFAPAAVERRAFVIDNSSAFRMDSDVPLLVPEINAAALQESCRLVSVPNCTAIILTMALHPLRALGEIRRVIVSTYQSASGGGAQMMEELLRETRGALGIRETCEENAEKLLPHPYAFNLFSHNTPVNAEGWNEEEWKVMQETRKILDLPDLPINVTCIRVPVLRAHCESVTVEFAGTAPSEEAIRERFAASPGVRVVDDRAGNVFPMPSLASEQGDVLVGRIRKDLSHPSAVSLFIAGDQLLKGAALNAVQIAEMKFRKG